MSSSALMLALSSLAEPRAAVLVEQQEEGSGSAPRRRPVPGRSAAAPPPCLRARSGTGRCSLSDEQVDQRRAVDRDLRLAAVRASGEGAIGGDQICRRPSAIAAISPASPIRRPASPPISRRASAAEIVLVGARRSARADADRRARARAAIEAVRRRSPARVRRPPARRRERRRRARRAGLVAERKLGPAAGPPNQLVIAAVGADQAAVARR